MSGELLTKQSYFDDDNDVQKVAPRHDFNHDLESILWILLWICLCKCGGGIRRPAMRDEKHPQHEELVKIMELLFQAENIVHLGEIKLAAILSERLFKRYLKYIDDFYRPLEPLLLKLYRILRAGYEAHHFDFDATMDAFRAAFDEAEQELIRNPPILTPEQDANVRAEEVRRVKDEDDWEHTPRPSVKRSARRPLPALQPLHPAIPEDPAESNAEDMRVSDDTQSSEDSREGSPTPGANTVDRKSLMLTSSKSTPRGAAAVPVPVAKPGAVTKAVRPSGTSKSAAPSKSANTGRSVTSTKAITSSKAATSSKTAPTTEPSVRSSRSRTPAIDREPTAAGTSAARSRPTSASSRPAIQKRADSRASRSARNEDVEQGTAGTGRGGPKAWN